MKFDRYKYNYNLSRSFLLNESVCHGRIEPGGRVQPLIVPLASSLYNVLFI